MNVVASAPLAHLVVTPANAQHHRVVLLDDDVAMLRALERLMVRAGFQVIATHDPKVALEAVVREGADVIVSDLYMPDIGGDVVLAMVAKAAPTTARVLLTSETDLHALAALSLPFSVGAFVPKREVSAQLVPTLRLLCGGGPTDDTLHPGKEARQLAVGIVRSLAGPSRSDLAEGLRLAAWSTHLGAAVGLDATQLLDLELGALLHDIGEVGLPPGLLGAPRGLLVAEAVEMRRHPEIGAALLANLFTLRRAIPVVVTHHEHFDGDGYPHRLSGNAIPIESRVFQIVDAYDAMRSPRPFRPGRSDAEARAELRRRAGTQFDPEIHDVFSRIDPEQWTSVVGGVRSP